MTLYPAAPPVAAYPKPGAICKTLGQIKFSNGKIFSCIKKGKKLVWNKGIKVSTSNPATAKNLYSSSLISNTAQLSGIQTCQTADVTFQGETSNGFPRPASFYSGPFTARLLVVPISFTDHVYGESDYMALDSVLSEVSSFYSKTSYGKVNLKFEILDKKLWVNMGRSAASYDLIANKPQQNNIQVVEDALNLVDESINFDLYDGVVVESGWFKSTGGGQGFPGRTFKTKNGVAKRVAFEFGMYVAKSDVLAHELGHSLFGLEDLYIFLNSKRPSVLEPTPAGSWDMMSNSSFEFLAWNKFLMGWLEDSQVRCVQSQSPTVHYAESLEINSAKPKLVVVNLQEGVSLAFEARIHSAPLKTRGLLVYKIDTRISHGDGPIIAQKRLVLAGENLQIDGWNVKVLDSDSEGVLFELSK